MSQREDIHREPTEGAAPTVSPLAVAAPVAAAVAAPRGRGPAPGLARSLTPDVVRDLQRTAGNVAVARYLSSTAGAGHRMLSRDARSDEVAEAIRNLPGGEYEFKVEHKGERASWSVRFAMQSSQTAFKQKPADVGKPGPSAGDTSFTLLPAKMTYAKQVGAGASGSMAAALAEADMRIAEIVRRA